MLYKTARPHLVKFIALNLVYLVLIFFVGMILIKLIILFVGSVDSLPYKIAKEGARSILLAYPNAVLLHFYFRALTQSQSSIKDLVPKARMILNLLGFQVVVSFVFGIPLLLILESISDPIVRLIVTLVLSLFLFWIGFRILFVPICLIDKNQSFWRATAESWSITQGKFWRVFIRCVFLLFIAVLGLLVFGVGYVLTMALATTGYILLYFEISSNAESTLATS